MALVFASRRQRAGFAVLAALAAILPVSAAGQADDPHAACAAVGWVPREVLQRPVPLRTGMGRTHEAVTTSSAEAQAFHDQGLAYLHSYVWIEAGRSFNQALRLDPKLALSWVGLSRVYSGLEDQPAARVASKKAQELAASASKKERRKIALRAVQLDAIEDIQDAGKHAAYKRALDEALAADMDDVELWLLRGNTEERNAAGRGQRGGAGSVAFYRQALAVSPDHFAAHHYLVHSYESIGHIDKALAHGEVYARLASEVPHAHHMWGHDLRRVGRVEDAIEEFRRAYDLETAYYGAEGLGEDLDWHRPHNLDLLATCYQHQGRMRTTEETMRERARIRPVTAYGDFNRKAWPGFLLGAGRYEEALTAARGMAATGRWGSGRAVGHALAAQALLGLGRVAEARTEMEAARSQLDQIPLTSGILSFSRGIVEPYVDAARGELLLRTGEREKGRALLREVQSRIRAVPGPDAWMEALFRLEEIARLARDVGDWELAAYTAGQMREHDAAYGGTHYALARVAEHEGDRARAREAYAEAVRLWSRADPDLPELRQARDRRDALGRLAQPSAAPAAAR
jgi:tetratricopeptide (TPR) repeat protein